MVLLGLLFSLTIQQGLLGTQDEVEEPAPLTQPTVVASSIGERTEIIYDRVTKVKGDHPMKDCTFFRSFASKHKYSNPEHPERAFIYYFIYQCLDESNKLKGQQTYFSYEENGDKIPLPPGCPPPVIRPPEKKDPCKMGFRVGQVVSRTVANVIVPQFVGESSENPLSDTPEFKQYLELKRNIDTDDVHEFNLQQKKIIDDYEKLIKKYADEKIKCFTEEVIPVKQIDIEFICAQQGAHESIEDALRHTLGSEVSCGHIACGDIEESLRLGRETNVISSVQSANNFVVPAEHAMYKINKPDFNGNYQIPKNGVPYRIVAMSDKSYLTNTNGENVLNKYCNEDLDQWVIFEKEFAFFRIKIKATNDYICVTPEHELIYQKEINVGEAEDTDPCLFKVLINNGGSVSFLSKKYTTKTIGYRAKGLVTKYFNQQDRFERFYIRRKCLDIVVKEFADESRVTAGLTEDTVITNAN